MIEVFKTDVTDRDYANLLLEHIRKTFPAYTVNFDLHDCDNILRVKCTSGKIQSAQLINLLKFLSCNAEVLPDEPSVSRLFNDLETHLFSNKKVY
jgi:hypothetical protein